MNNFFKMKRLKLTHQNSACRIPLSRPLAWYKAIIS